MKKLAMCLSVVLLLSAAPQEEEEKEKQPEKQEEKVNCLKALGGMSAEAMYSTYFAIGAIADGFGKDVYTAEQVESLMKSLGGMAAHNAKQIRNFKEHGKEPTEADKKSLEEVAAILDLLKKEADALTTFTKSKKKEDAEAFQAARKEVWGRIKTFLGIK